MISKKSKPFYYIYKNYSYNSAEKPYEIDLFPGKYYIECVGAGGGSNVNSGYGAKVSGYVKINKTMKVFLYIGGKGEDGSNSGSKTKGGFNGGGKGGAGLVTNDITYWSGGGGGGATDLRLIKGSSWSESSSLTSRVIVAAGGGGRSFQLAGSGGKLEGLPTSGSQCNFVDVVKGGTQNDGYAFGYGMDGADGVGGSCGSEGNGGGGGGWYGGFASDKTGENSNLSGGGGSSYISGLIGCVVNSEFVFTHTYMEDGLTTKNKGNGYAVIGRLSPVSLCRKYHSSSNIFTYLFVLCIK